MKKIIVLALTLALVGTFALTATMAYLTGETDPVENVFILGHINIHLTEDGWGKDDDGNSIPEFKGKIIPGEVIAKNPIVTVEKGSEDCYLFVCLENTLAVSTGIGTWDYVVPNIDKQKWDLVHSKVEDNGVKKELYRYKVAEHNWIVNADTQKKLSFFTQVTVPDVSFTKESMETLGKVETITIEAFAHQSEHVSEGDAKDEAIKQFFPSP